MLKDVKACQGCYSTIFKTSNIHRGCSIVLAQSFHSVDRCRRSAQPRKRHGNSDRRPEPMKCRCGLARFTPGWQGGAMLDMTINDSYSPMTDFE